jgi:predicted nucleotidyltransferase
MVELIAQKLAEIQKACEERNVAFLQLFGSAARGDDFTEKSD